MSEDSVFEIFISYICFSIAPRSSHYDCKINWILCQQEVRCHLDSKTVIIIFRYKNSSQLAELRRLDSEAVKLLTTTYISSVCLPLCLFIKLMVISTSTPTVSILSVSSHPGVSVCSGALRIFTVLPNIKQAQAGTPPTHLQWLQTHTPARATARN